MSITFVFLKPEMRYVIRGKVRSWKCSLGEMSFGELSCGKMFFRGSVLLGKCPSGNSLSGIVFRELSVGEMSFGELSSENCPNTAKMSIACLYMHFAFN